MLQKPSSGIEVETRRLGTEQRHESTNGIEHPTYFSLSILVEQNCDDSKL